MKRFTAVKFSKSFLKILFLSVFSISVGYGQQEEGIYDQRTNTLYEDQSPPTLSIFENRSTLRVEIETDQKKLFSNIEDPKKQKGLMILYLNDSIKIVKSIKVKVRGNTRKKICDIPPLKIDLNETEFLSEWLGPITSLKLVNACSQNERSREYLQREYVIYEMYGSLTEKSYQVRMIDLEIKDSKEKQNPISGYAFVIENDKSIARRTELVETEIEETNVAELINAFYLYPNEETLLNMNILSIFQYMIGNSDWHITNLHNVKMFGNEEVQYAIPYDFDYSGFVNANYAIPSSSLPIKKVTDRYYLGPCSDPVVVEKALDRILEAKNIFYQKINFHPYLEANEKISMTSYLDQFFKESKDKQALVSKLSGFNCTY